GDVDRQRPLLEHTPGPVARRARVLDNRPVAPTTPARLGADELSEDRARNGLQSTAAATLRARHRRRAGLGAAAPAGRALDGYPHRTLPPGVLGCLDQVDLDLGGDVRAARRAPQGADAEEIVPEEGGEEIAQSVEVEARRGETAAAQASVSESVVELAPL